MASSPFCSTCLSNQHLFIQNLNGVLPEPENPQYADIVASLPEIRKRLEERYPQVCTTCEPKVRAQLLQATYTAKSDHLRRMLERSRRRQVSDKWGWRSLVVRIGGVGYFSSISGQLLWHSMAALSSQSLTPTLTRPTQCLQDLFTLQTVAVDCANNFELFAGISLALGVICIWWNPKWQHKLQGKEGRMIGLNKYYQAQAGIFALRLSAWLILQDHRLATSLPMPPKPLHSILLVLFIFLTIWSTSSILKIDTTPLVDWSQAPAPLLSKQQFVPPRRHDEYYSSSQSPQVTAMHSFPINNLGSAPVQRYDAWQPRDPPDDPDAMDWEPLPSQFQPKLKQPVRKPTQPSPFYGTLPALPAMGVSRFKTSSTSPARQAIGIPPGFFDKPRKDPAGHISQDEAPAPILAQPTFFPQQDRVADTGLEGIFDQVFSLRDGPQTLHPTQHADGLPAPRAPNPPWTTASLYAAIALPGLFLSVIAWFALH